MFPNIEEQVYELFIQMENDKRMMFVSGCPSARDFFKQRLLRGIDTVSTFLSVQTRLYNDNSDTLKQRSDEEVYNLSRQRQITVDELMEFDGSGEKPAYVAVDGVIYDVSANPAWGAGSHYGLMAGRELTEAFEGCHGMKAILDKLPVVGTLAE